MIKILLVAFFLLIVLEARENPFFPAKGEKEIPYTSNNILLTESLKQTPIMLPSSARVIKKVTIEYENLDASVGRKSITVDNSFDWHLPIFLSQSYTKENSSSKPIIKKNESIKYKKIAYIKHASFYVFKKSLKVISKDKIIRNFSLTNPHRIVIDFKRDTNLKSYTKNTNLDVFKKIRVGNHDGYYRVVVELDGQYKYKIKKTSNGYVFNLR